MPHAWVAAGGSAGSTATNLGGEFELHLKPADTYVLEARRLGFHPAKLVLDGGARLDSVVITLSAVARTLDQVTIATTAPSGALARAGFYQRMIDAGRGLLDGEFVTPEQLELRRPPKISHILDGIRGVRLRHDPRMGAIPFSARGNCAMTIYLDGARFQVSGHFDDVAMGGRSQIPSMGARPAMGGSRRGKDEGMDAAIPASHIAAIEVYPSGTFAPPQFQLLNGTCGIIALWTKSGG